MKALPHRGLYVITDSRAGSGRVLATAVAAAIRGGACMVQYRDKSGDAIRRRAEARLLREVCDAASVPLIVNDDVELALSVGADGVHLGRDDVAIASARERLGANAIIGISCYNEPSRAIEGQVAGADYVAFGRFFASGTKPGAAHATVPMLSGIRSKLRLPVVAIGGVNAANAPLLLEAGADKLLKTKVRERGDEGRGCSLLAHLLALLLRCWTERQDRTGLRS